MPAPDPYDLTLASSDFPPWSGPPRRSILICSHPRSGSTLLGEAVAAAGGLGCPLEYLHRGFRPALSERWQASDLATYIAAIHRHRTEPNGVLSIKVFWQDIEDVGTELEGTTLPEDPSTEDYRRLYRIVRGLLPHPEFVYLKRLDRVRQAVSAVVAVQTGKWRSIDGVGRQVPTGAADYDYERILGMVAYADHCHARWQAFFAANEITPRTLTYEQLVANYEDAVSPLLTALGAHVTAPQPQRMRRQADTTSEAMVRRFLADHAARAS